MTLAVKACLGSAALLILGSVGCLADAPNVVYRTPDSFGQLPADFKTALGGMGCRIPQGMADGKVVYENVISGELAAAGQTDWAIVCSRAGHLFVEVYWGGPVQCTSPIDLTMTITEDYPFDQGINTADAHFIYERFEAYGGPTPPTVTHLGIEYGFYAKGSTVYYCHGGKWLELTGAD
jgi:hypothetical protein